MIDIRRFITSFIRTHQCEVVCSRLDTKVYQSTLGVSALNFVTIVSFAYLTQVTIGFEPVVIVFCLINLVATIARITFAKQSERNSDERISKKKKFVAAGVLVSLAWLGVFGSIVRSVSIEHELAAIALLITCAQIAAVLVTNTSMLLLMLAHVFILGYGSSLIVLINAKDLGHSFVGLLGFVFTSSMLHYAQKLYRSVEAAESSLLDKRRENERINSLINAVPGFMSLIDRDLNYLMVNRAFQERVHSDIVGKRLGVMEKDSELVRFVHQFAVSDETHVTQEFKFGPLFNTESYLVSLTKLGGESGHIAIVSMNIEKQKEAENQLRQAISDAEHSARLSELGELVSSVAHEIRSPLTVISGRAELLKIRAKKGDGFDPEKVVKDTECIVEMTGTINKIIQTVLKYGRTDKQLPMVHTRLREIVEDSVVLVKPKAKTSSVELRLPSTMPDGVLNCHAIQINQVLVNLLNNAIDASRELSDRWVKLEVELDGKFVVFKVIDCGTGLPDDVLANISKPFFTTKPPGQGTGLGLSMVRRIVAQHAGEFSVDTKAANTTFVVKLPLIQETRLPAAA